MNKLLRSRCALVLLAAGPMLAGCGADQAALQKQAEEQARRIEALEASASEARASHAREMEALRAELTEAHQRELDDLGSTLRREVNEHSRTIANLRDQLAARAAPPQKVPPVVDKREPASPPPPADPTPTISVYTPPAADRSHFLVPPTGPKADLFPIRVDSVQGERIVVGSHTTSRMVETGEMVKDKYGEEQPVMKPEKLEVNDYDTQVTFTAENLTRNPVTIEYRAGRDRETVGIPSGATIECKAASLVGASLSVRANGESRTFPVSYP